MKLPRAIHEFFLFNNRIVGSSDFEYCAVNEGLIIYDVIRVLKGIPLFVEEHVHRLEYSAQLAHVTIHKKRVEIIQDILLVINQNNVETGNLRLVFQYLGEITNYLIYFVKHEYPGNHQYQNGISTCLLRKKRNLPEAKVQQDEVRQMVLEILQQKDVYEVLLVDDQDIIREGSKSNLFFVKKNHIYTCPANLVLNGITRKCLFDICSRNNLPIHEQKIKIQDLEHMESAFITGTSPKILPIRNIENTKLNVNNSLTRELMYFYDQMIEQYLSTFKP